MTPQEQRAYEAGYTTGFMDASVKLHEQSTKDQFRDATEMMAQPEHICGFDVVLDKLMPPNTFKFVQPEQKPVAFLTNRRQRLSVEFNATGLTLMPKSVDWKIPLYTTPPYVATPRQRKPLTDEQLRSVWEPLQDALCLDYKVFARAIEAAHGIYAPPELKE